MTHTPYVYANLNSNGTGCLFVDGTDLSGITSRVDADYDGNCMTLRVTILIENGYVSLNGTTMYDRSISE